MFLSSNYVLSKEIMVRLLTKISNQVELYCWNIIEKICDIDTEHELLNDIDSIRCYVKYSKKNATPFSYALNQCVELTETLQQHYDLIRDELMLSSCGVGPSKMEVFHKLLKFIQRGKDMMTLFTFINYSNEIIKFKIPGTRNDILFLKAKMDTFQSEHPNPFLTLLDDKFESDFENMKEGFRIRKRNIEHSVSNWITKSSSVIKAQNLFDKVFPSKFIFCHTTEQESSARNESSTRSKKLIHPDVLSIFRRFQKEVYNIESIYERYKSDPPLQRNESYASGCIKWAQHLKNRIQPPMQWFISVNDDLIFGKEDLNIKCNRLILLLDEFENSHFDIWCKESIVHALSSIESSIWYMPWDENNNEAKLVANLDHNVLHVIKDTKSFLRLGLNIPHCAEVFTLHNKQLQIAYRDACAICTDWDEYKQMIKISQDGSILNIVLQDISDDIDFGVRSITWTSMQLNDYISRIREKLNYAKRLSQNLKDTLSTIRRKIVQISQDSIQLFSDTCGIENILDFLEINHLAVQNRKAFCIEIYKNINDMIEGLSEWPSNATTYSNSQYEHNHFTKANLAKEIKNCQSKLRCLTQKSISHNLKCLLRHMTRRICCDFNDGPIIKVEVKMSPQSLSISPTFDEIKSVFYKLFSIIVDIICDENVFKTHTGRQGCKTYDRSRFIVKECLILYSTLAKVKRDLQIYLQNSFGKFDRIWRGRHDFLYLSILRYEKKKCETFGKEDDEKIINTLNDKHRIGPLFICSRNMKNQLLKECS